MCTLQTIIIITAIHLYLEAEWIYLWFIYNSHYYSVHIINVHKQMGRFHDSKYLDLKQLVWHL